MAGLTDGLRFLCACLNDGGALLATQGATLYQHVHVLETHLGACRCCGCNGGLQRQAVNAAKAHGAADACELIAQQPKARTTADLQVEGEGHAVRAIWRAVRGLGIVDPVCPKVSYKDGGRFWAFFFTRLHTKSRKITENAMQCNQ